MSFTEAIKDGFNRITDFEGRSSRPAFWWWYLFIVIIAVIVDVITLPLASSGNDGAGALAWIIWTVLWVVIALASLAVTVRRLHDTNKSGWWWFIQFVPCIGWIWLIVLMVMPSDPGPNNYGNPA